MQHRLYRNVPPIHRGGHKIEAGTRGHPYRCDIGYEGYKAYMAKYMREWRKKKTAK